MSMKSKAASQFTTPRNDQIIILVLIAGWTLLACLLGADAVWSIDQRFTEHNEAEINAFLERDFALRAWILDNGGIYVRKSEKVQANPLLAHVPESVVLTPSGKRLVLLNGAYAMRLLAEEYNKNNPEGITVRATSLRPKRPESTPDQWERQALTDFQDSGLREVTGREQVGGHTYLRSMVPLYARDYCLKCHNDKGYYVGDLIGGLSIKQPLDKKLERQALEVRQTVFQFGVIWLVGVVALLVSRRELQKRSRARDVAEMGMKKAFDEMEQRVLERTAELSETAQKLQAMALTDGLTGLHNRRYFLELLQAECQRSARHGNALSLLMMDLDHFKQINDAHGHPVGDKALKAFAHCLGEAVRTEDRAGRLGGEEFGVILPETTLNQALVLAERIRVAVAALRLPGSANQARLTVSIGAAQLQRRTESVESLLKRADEMLYLAKNKGRNRTEPSPNGLA